MAGPTPATGSPVKSAATHNLLLRIVSSIVLAAIALTLAYLGGPLFILFWAIAAGAVWWEWLRLVNPDASSACLAASFSALAIATLLLIVERDAFAALALALGIAAAAMLAPRNPAWTGAGMVYAGSLLVATALLRGDDTTGRIVIFFLFAIVWTTDILAYFVGRAIGGPKLAPAISPNKTWSGAIGGTIAAIAAGLGLVAASGGTVTLGLGIVALILSIVSQAGDLFESRLKRLFNVKDSSALIPGHGGVMDRLDGFIVAAAAALLIGAARSGWTVPAHGVLGW